MLSEVRGGRLSLEPILKGIWWFVGYVHEHFTPVTLQMKYDTMAHPCAADRPEREDGYREAAKVLIKDAFR